MNNWVDDKDYQFINKIDGENASKFKSDSCDDYVDEEYIEKKKSVTIRKWRVKIV